MAQARTSTEFSGMPESAIATGLEMLGLIGLAVDPVTNGLEAYQKAKARYYDLVLMDMQMPKMDGLEATKAIRSLPGWESTPILALTANAFGEDREACLASGMNDFISKPVEWKSLWALMLKWLQADLASRAVLRRDGASHSPLWAGHRFMTHGAAFQCRERATLRTLEALQHVNGMNLLAGLRGLLGNADRYVEILAQFVRHHSTEVALLSAALASGDGTAARHLAHSLKGAAGALGAERIADLAGSLEHALQPPGSAGWAAGRLVDVVDQIESELVDLAGALPPIHNSSKADR
jgi:CheY-like chemotaxis protein